MKILVIDDDEDLARMLSRFLEAHGYEVHCAGDALQGLDLLARAPDVGLVITDLMMPHLDGLSLTEAIRADPKRKDLQIIVITAFGSEQKSELTLRKGASLVLDKPVDFDKLLALVKFAE